MSFANPLFFWALLSLAVPILIHLFRFRRFRTVFFTNIRFLQELRKETHSRSRLRHLLILIARCLAITALVIAFAKPFIPSSHKAVAGRRAVSIYIDNSFSMDARGESSTLLELAKKQAREIVESFHASDRFQLITNDFEGRHQRLLSAEQFKEMLNEVNLTPAAKKISAVVNRQIDLLRQSDNPNKIIYLLSDFQREMGDFKQTRTDTTFSLRCVYLEAALADNISIDSAWFDNPYREKNKPENLWIKATNHSGKRFDNIPVKLIVDSVQRGMENMALGPDSSGEKKIVFTAGKAGFHSAKLEITDYPIVFDDSYYISWNTPELIKVLCINGGAENAFLNQLFLKNQAFDYRNIPEQQLDFAALTRQECIILNEVANVSSGLAQELKKFVNQGGTLLVFPSLKSDLSSWSAFSSSIGAGIYDSPVTLSQKAISLNSRHPVYDDVFDKQPDGVDLPEVKVYLPIRTGQMVREEMLMRLQNGDRLLTQFDAGKGKIYMAAVPLNDASGNFQKHALFIPTVYKIALYSLPPVRLSYYIGEESAIPLGNLALGKDQTLRMKNLEGTLEIIPEHRIIEGRVWIYPGTRINKAGNYRILQGDQEVARLSFNYSRKESLPERLSRTELEKQMEDAGWQADILDGNLKEFKQAVAISDQGKPLWKLFIILALIFLAIEILIIRLVK
jgi:hypothetical protein